MHKVTWTTNAERTFRQLDRVTKSRVRVALEDIANNPFDEENSHITKLFGEMASLCRYHAGTVSIIYRAIKEQSSFRVIAIDPGRTQRIKRR